MSEPANGKNKKLKRVSLTKNAARVTLGLTSGLLCLNAISEHSSSFLYSIVTAVLIAYVCSSAIWIQIAKLREYTNNYYAQISSFDAAILSAALAFSLQNYIVSSSIFSLVVLHSMLIGGPRQTVSDATSFFLGACAVTLYTQTPWTLDTAPSALIILFAGSVVYVLLYAFFIRQRVERLNTKSHKLHNDIVLHKLRSYKLSRYVSPTVWKALNKGKDSTLKTERKRVSVFFSDISGFSALSEELEAETLTELLNTYLTEMVKIAAAHRGTIDKFMGDGLMVIYGDTNSDGMKADALRCVAMAVDMRKKMKELETKWFNQGIKKPLKIRMGINSGYCTVGTFGTSEYMDYTVLGTHVNLASRLESAADSGEILISHETWSLIKDVVMCRDRGEIKAKGFSAPIKVYQVVDFRKDMGRNQSYFEEHSHGFSIHLDLEKIKNYDRSKIIDHLEALAEKVREKV